MSELTARIAELVSKTGVQATYGDAIDMDGTTVVPVAASWFGFGVGESDSGSESSEGEGEGSGGGGGGVALPVGAYVTRDGVTRFEPNTIALVTVAIPFVCVTGHAVARVFRSFRGKR